MNSPQHFIRKLRAKPEHIRRRIVVCSTLALFGVIFFGWLMMVSVKLNRSQGLTDEMYRQNSPASSFGSQFGDLFDSIKSLFDF